jgi:hypothetical protein
MSAELGRDHEQHFGVPPARPASVKEWLEACSYGPFGYLQAIVIGFISGSIAFLIGDAAFNSAPGQKSELPILLAFAGGGALLLMGLAIFGNYLIGRRVRDEVELEREIFGGGTLPPACPRPDVPGIDLRPDRPADEPARQRPLPAKREVEHQ